MSAAPSLKPGASITEVVVQGIRRFGEVRRFALGPGYNVLYGLSAAGKSTLRDVMLSLMFAKSAEDEATFKSLLPQGATACRAGMTLSLNGEVFRVLKDYLQGSVTLSRQTPDRKFELISADPKVIQDWLVTQAKMTVGPDYARLFAINRSDFPSTYEVSSPTASKSSVDGAFEDRLKTMSLPEKRNALNLLLDEFRRHAEVKTTEFLQDGLRSKMFEVDALLRKRDEAQERLNQVQAEVHEIEGVPKLPDGFEERLDSYKRQEKTREGELADLRERQTDAHAGLALVIPAPFTEADLRAMNTPQEMIQGLLKKDLILDGGIAALFVGLICATFFHKPVNLVGVLLLAGGAGLLVWRGLLVFLKAKEQFDGLRKDVDRIDEQVRMIEKKWEIETTVIRNLMKAYKVDDPREMREIEKRRDELVARRASLQAAVDAIQLPTGENLDAAKARFQAQIDSIDQRMQATSGNFTVDPKDLEPQIERLDRDISRAEGRRPTPRGKLFGREEDMASAVEQTGNAIVAVVESWCGSRSADNGRLLRGITEAFSQNVRALSGGKYFEGVFDADGSVSLREEGKAPVSFEMLDGLGKDVAWLALRVTLFQLETRGSARLVALLDDPFEFEEGRLGAISRALKALGPTGQVIHLTSRPSHSKLADVALEI